MLQHVFKLLIFPQAKTDIANWSRTSGWRENAFVLSPINICFILDNILGKMWKKVVIGVYGESLPSRLAISKVTDIRRIYINRIRAFKGSL